MTDAEWLDSIYPYSHTDGGQAYFQIEVDKLLRLIALARKGLELEARVKKLERRPQVIRMEPSEPIDTPALDCIAYPIGREHD